MAITLCRSDVHEHPTAATVTGLYRESTASVPEEIHLCRRCAALLRDHDSFTPTDGTVLPSFHDLLTGKAS